MKRIVSSLLAVVVVAALILVTTTSKHVARLVYAQSGCSPTSLTGNYAFKHLGFTSKNVKGNPLPAAAVGVFSFDGSGNFLATYTDMSPGKPTYIATQGTSSGSYTVNPDCTGSGTFTSGNAAGLTFNLVIISGGAEAIGIDTTPFLIATTDFKKQ